MDQVPRFFQGDSISYLMSGAGNWLPPDRSWAYGFVAHWLLATTRNYQSYILLNNIILLAMILGLRSFFPAGTRSHLLCYTVCAVAVAADPLLALYTRFYLSDFAALVMFAGFIASFRWSLRVDRSLSIGTWLALLFAIGAVFTRVAYAPVILLTIVLVLVRSLVHRRSRVGRQCVVALLIPFVAVGSLALGNAAVFGGEFGHRPFVNKLSGPLLMGVFAPALSNADFAKAGIKLSPTEFSTLDLGSYDHRSAVAFGIGRESARLLIMEKLGITDNYSDAVNAISDRIVLNGLLRNPLGFVKTYLVSLVLYFEPAEWHRILALETGVKRPLEPWFVNWFNILSVSHIYPEIVAVPSVSLDAYGDVQPAYPLFLGVVFLVAIGLLLRRRTGPDATLLSAAFVAALLSAALYSDYVVPRYVLANVLGGYVLLCVVLRDLLAVETRREG